MHSIPIITAPNSKQLGRDALAWLQQQQHPFWVDIAGQNQRRHRVVSTLLHGNEPSGLVALHRWLQLKKTPAVNMSFLIASVGAALHPPAFSQRMLPGQRDLNRCFKAPFNDKPGWLAQQIINRVRQIKPECIIDIHNTSGSGPSFAVAVADQFEQRVLARYFCRRMIVTELRLASLMEVDEGCPTVTIECGGAKDRESEQTAFDGLDRIACTESLFFPGGDQGMEVLHKPIRVELQPNVSVAYSDQLLETVDITLKPDIERCNYGITPTHRCLGWIGKGGLQQLRVRDEADVEQLHNLLREEEGWLFPARDLHIFMATTSAQIARDDCLFYVVPDS